MASSVQEREELELLRLRKKKAQAAQSQPSALETPPAEQQAYAEQGKALAAQGGLTLGPEPRSPMAGAGETAAALGSGAVLGPLSGLAGLAGMAMPGPNGQGGDWARAVQGMAYQPRTLEGQVGTEIATAPFVALNKLANVAGERVAEGPNPGPLGRPMGGSPLLGAAVNTGINTIPMWAPALANRMWPEKPPASAPAPSTPNSSIPLESIRQPQNAVRMETWKEANAAGYKFPPTAIEQSATRGVVESVGGKAALKQKTTIANQQATNQLAREAAGLGKWQPITKKALKDAREAASGPYKEVAKLYKGAEAELQTLKETRHQAQAAWNLARNGDPAGLKLAIELDKQTAAIETALEATARDYGRPGLVADLRQSRTKIAQNYNVDRALNYATGDVYANELGALWEAKGGQGFTGPLLTIAKTAKAFAPFMGPASKVPAPGVGQLQAAMSAFAMGEVASGKPGGIINAALWPLSGIARKAAMSERMQQPLRSGGPGLSLRQLGQIPPGILTPSLGLRPPPEE